MREDWASAVSSVHSHMVQCPGSTMLNDKEPSLSIIIDRHTFTDTSVCLCMCTHRCVHTHKHTHTDLHAFSDMQDTSTQPYIYTSMHTQKHAQSTFTGRHTHLLHFA